MARKKKPTDPTEAGSPGRPTELTSAVQRAYLKAIPHVYFLETAADLIGVHRTTVRRWMKQGEQDLDEGKATVHAGFCIAAREAISKKLQQHVKAANTFAKKDAKVLLWLIEKIAPDLWGDMRSELGQLKKAVEELKKSRGERGSD